MNQSRNDVNYIEKVLRVYGDLSGDLHLVELQRNRTSSSLGLSLVGNRDIACMSVFVMKIEPLSVAGLDGRIHVGDELLEINDNVLYGRSHLNASAIIKGINSLKLKILLLRDKNFLDRIAIEPIIAQTSLHYKDSSATLIPRKQNTSDLEKNEFDVEPEINRNSSNGSPQTGSSDDSQTIRDHPPTDDLPDVIEINPKISPCDISDEHNEVSGTTYVEVQDNGALQQSDDPSSSKASKLRLKIFNASDNRSENHSKEFDDNGISHRNDDKLNSSNHIEAVLQDALNSSDATDDDPLTCAISSGKPTVIHLPKGKQPLGIQVIGGSDSALNSIFVFQIHKDGAVDRDGRLAVGDQILEANGEDLTVVTNLQVHQIMRRPSAVLTLVVLRDAFQEDDLYDQFTIELFKKPGKGLGFSIVSKRDGIGTLIADIIRGGLAELDGRLMAGDEIVSVNGDNISNAKQDHAAHLMKTVFGQVSLSIKRLKTGLQPVGLYGNSYANISSDGSLKKSDSIASDRKSISKQVSKRKYRRYRSVASCLNFQDD